MFKKFRLIYVPFIPQSQTINWIDRCVNQLNKKNIQASILDLSDQYWPKFYTHFFQKKLHKYIFLKYIPLIHKNFSSRANLILNSLIFSISNKVKRRKTVVISSIFNNQLIDFIAFSNPNLVIGDACDYLNKEATIAMQKNSHIIVTNSKPILTLHQKNHSDVRLISAGYFSKNEVKRIRENCTFREKTIIFIGTIDWRLDIEFVIQVMKKLPKYKFVFYYTETFSISGSKKTHTAKKNLKAKKLWKKLTQQSNFQGIKIVSQQDLSKEKIKAAVGIIAYTSKGLFNRYCHPIKFYNYLALGIHIVSKPLKSVSEYNLSYVSFTDDVDDYCKEIEFFSKSKLSLVQQKEAFNLSLTQTIDKKTEDLRKIVYEYDNGKYLDV
jgi:hypothetical protein